MDLRSVTRGKFRQLVTSDGGPVLVKLYRCTVDKAPYAKNSKTYVTFDITEALGNTDILQKVDAFITVEARPAFTPLWGPLVVVKMPLTATYENEQGDPTQPFFLNRGDVVDIELSPGAFGKFGYCWLLKRVKPHKHTE